MSLFRRTSPESEPALAPRAIPPIDLQVPAALRTATFAVG